MRKLSPPIHAFPPTSSTLDHQNRIQCFNEVKLLVEKALRRVLIIKFSRSQYCDGNSQLLSNDNDTFELLILEIILCYLRCYRHE